MKRLARTFLVAIVAVVMTAGLFGGVHGVSAGNGYEQWTVGWSDSCSYYWNGFNYTGAACPRADSGYNFYSADAGQWVYGFSAGYTVNGNFWLLYQGITFIQVANPSVDTAGYSSAVVGGGGACDHTLCTEESIIFGHDSTGNPLVDALRDQYNQTFVASILAVHCIPALSNSNTCYYDH